MFVVKNPSAVATRYVAGIRIGNTEYLVLPLSAAARKELAEKGKKIESIEWMSPYGDILKVEEAEFGLYDFVLNDELIGAKLRAEETFKLITAAENNRPLIAWKEFRGLPTARDIPSAVKIGFVYKTLAGRYVLASVGRLSPFQLLELEKLEWDTGMELAIDVPNGKVVRVAAHHGFAVGPVTVNGNTTTVPELVDELNELGVKSWTFRDLPSQAVTEPGGFRGRR